jgi:hypothetical protein
MSKLFNDRADAYECNMSTARKKAGEILAYCGGPEREVVKEALMSFEDALTTALYFRLGEYDDVLTNPGDPRPPSSPVFPQ